MSDTINYTININGNVSDVLDKIGIKSGSATDKVTGLRRGLTKLGDSLFTLNNIKYAFDGIQQSINSAIQPGVAYNSQLTELSAITNVTGKKLKEIGHSARDNAKAFGGDAGKSLESYKLLLSKLGPEIANVPTALQSMGKNVSILSKTMGGDTVAAADVLTTAMNQFQVSLDNPTQASKVMSEMMNTMAAAAQVGSAELPAIKAALEQSGMAAKTAGVSFAETNAAIQVLDKAGKKGAEGGVALRNTLSILGEGRFMPKDTREALQAAGIDINALGDRSLSLADRLKLLQPVMGDTALMSKIFGRENANAGIALLAGIDQIESYTEAITGTNSAYDQAALVMGSYQEKMSRMRARFDNLKISFFNMTKSVLPAMQVAFYGLNAVTQAGAVYTAIASVGEAALAKAISNRASMAWKAVAAQWAMVSSGGVWSGVATVMSIVNLALAASFKAVGRAIYSIPIIGWIAAGIVLLVGLFRILNSGTSRFRQVLLGVWEATKAVFYNIGIVLKAVWENIIKPVFQFIWSGWSDNLKNMVAAIVYLWNGMVSAFSAVGKFIYDYLVAPVWNAINWLINAIATLFSSVWSWFGNLFGGLTSWLNANLLEPIKAVFFKMWDFVSGILDRIINALAKPIAWIKELWNKIFPKDKFKDIGEAYKQGVENGKKKPVEPDVKKTEGITIPDIPGMQQGVAAIGGGTFSGGGAKGLSNDITGGGTRNTSVNIQFTNMVENIVFDGTMKDKRADLEREITSIMARVLGMAQSVA
ncbi:MAG: phage tail tape measure protein [Bacteroidales bacterium]|nr:phage tail tape measure protein [Bacteroidales bacterium]MDD3665144.1 phage tail tape measure protein [Bacteroidales bacterium]